MKNTDWYRLSTLCPEAPSNAYFGITKFANVADFLHPERILKKDSTVIWIPAAKAHIGIASYMEAVNGLDPAGLEKLKALGVPSGLDFGIPPGEDLSCTYAVATSAAPPKRKKAPSVKVMRAEFAAEYEDGTRFEKGTVVKIFFRKRFVEDRGGTKKFRNVYERPTEDELKAFLESERA